MCARWSRDGIAEAALVVTPVPSHYAYSVYLSSHGIHNMCETTWCSLVAQAREMIRVAREQGVVVRVAENFFRFACDRFAQTVQDSGFYRSHRPHLQLRRSHRGITTTRAGCAFLGIQCGRRPSGIGWRRRPSAHCRTAFHSGEHFKAHYFGFAAGEMVADQLANWQRLVGAASAAWVHRMARRAGDAALSGAGSGGGSKQKRLCARQDAA